MINKFITYLNYIIIVFIDIYIYTHFYNFIFKCTSWWNVAKEKAYVMMISCTYK